MSTFDEAVGLLASALEKAKRTRAEMEASGLVEVTRQERGPGGTTRTVRRWLRPEQAQQTAEASDKAAKLKQLQDEVRKLQAQIAALKAERSGPARAKPPPDERVAGFVKRLEAARGTDTHRDVMREIEDLPTDVVKQIAHAAMGMRPRSRKDAMKLIQNRHDMLVGARARDAHRAGRTAA
jgi:hypothetical protein